MAFATGVRARLLGFCVACSLVASACMGGGSERPVVIEANTPEPSPTRPAGIAGDTIAVPELVLSTETIFQGGATLASVTGDITGGSITFLDRTFTLTQGARSLYTFLPAPIDAPPGAATMTIAFTLANGTQGTMEYTITILETEWTVDYLTFSPSQMAALLDPEVTASEAQLLRTVYSGHTPEKLWTDGWQVPVNAAITARFGEQRSINGSEPSGNHGGTDLGAADGTPVRATNSGRVVLARQLTIRGNVVVIDHGGGLFSGYGHLSAFAVAEGQVVAKGDVIGESGNTGLSTAPHLHWEIAQSGVLLDAFRFADGTNGF